MRVGLAAYFQQPCIAWLAIYNDYDCKLLIITELNAQIALAVVLFYKETDFKPRRFYLRIRKKPLTLKVKVSMALFLIFYIITSYMS